MRNAVLISFCKTRVHYDDMHRERKIFWTSNIMIRTSQYFLHTVRRTSASEFFFRTLCRGGSISNIELGNRLLCDLKHREKL